MEFSQDQFKVLEALMDRIIPRDDFPSATENGVGNFIRHILQTDLKHRAQEVQLGLIWLNEESIALNGRPFTEQSADGQDRLLRLIETGENVRAVWPIPPQRFFEWMVKLTNEGYYSDPGNGANIDGVSWRMIGYDPRVPLEPARERWLERKR
jgi:hypothetical protein